MRTVMSADLEALIQDVLDGTATPEARARLAAELASNPAARERQEQMAAVFEKLQTVHVEEAPAGLRAEVLNRLRAPGARERAHELGRARRNVQARGSLRLVLPFALGFAAGAIAFVGWRGMPMRDLESGVAGSMMPAGGAIERWREGRLSVVVRGERRDGIQVLGIHAESSEPGAVLELRWRPSSTRLAGFRQTDARADGIEIDSDHVTLHPLAGSQYRLELRQLDGGGPVVVTSRSNVASSVRTLAADFGSREER